MIRLALFGTYTIVAIGIGELRKRLSRTRMPAAHDIGRPGSRRARAARGTTQPEA